MSTRLLKDYSIHRFLSLDNILSSTLRLLLDNVSVALEFVLAFATNLLARPQLRVMLLSIKGFLLPGHQ